MPIFRTNSRSSKIESSSFRIEEFKLLFNLLTDKVNEALEFELKNSQFIKQAPAEKRGEIEQNIRNLFKLSVHIVGSKGEYIVADEVNIFDDENFPNKINMIVFDSSFYYKQVTNQEPMNKVIVEVDFKKQHIFDFSYPSTAHEKNASSITVAGSDDTWVSGVHSKILSFLEERKTNRNWLHKRHFYDLFLYILFYPIVFWFIFRASGVLQGKVPTVFLVAVCFYVFMLLLFILRILFNYTRWIFPLIEFAPKSGTKMARHRAVLGTLILAFISSLVYDITKSFF